MWGSVRNSRLAYLVAALLTLGAATTAIAGTEPPRRVVSINLCTDQLAMLLAAKGQLHSVSHIAADPMVSAMAQEAGDYTLNHGRAEEIYMMRPDLVLAGPYTSRTTTAMLERLGIPVAVIPTATSLEDVRGLIARMGEVLHREAAAAEMVAAYDTRLEALRRQVEERPRAVLYHANGMTTGDSTLAGQILLAAGFANAAARAGYGAGMKLPLEVLAMIAPDIVITGRPYPGGSRSEEILGHPAVRAFRQGMAGAAVSDHDWVCGTPYVLRAVEELAATRRAMTGRAQ